MLYTGIIIHSPLADANVCVMKGPVFPDFVDHFPDFSPFPYHISRFYVN